MNIIDIISQKRDHRPVSFAQWDFLIQGYIRGDIPDYQVSAFLMAAYLNGLNSQEITDLAQIMLYSGETYSFSDSSYLVDKHSTGGVGDKISLILAPLVASCGVKVPMLAGRGLGHTGGTLDKMESISEYSTSLTREKFIRLVNTNNYALSGQTKTLVPADRLLYGLRDVTGTVESLGLITASIVSKKIAEGAHGLVFDVKWGSGAFMKTKEQAKKLAQSLLKTTQKLGRDAVAILSNMNQPLGAMVGNFLEVEETVECLEGGGPQDVVELTLNLASHMLLMAQRVSSLEQGYALAQQQLSSGKALLKFYENVVAQGGNVQLLKSQLGKRRASLQKPLFAPQEGFVSTMDTYSIGRASVLLKAGRQNKTDIIDFNTGIQFFKKVGDAVKKGEHLCTLYGQCENDLDVASSLILKSYRFSTDPPEILSLIEEICS